ncbi:MAG: hypothetical protein ACKOJF_21505, partial [Planctomycetaceae bacterium]
MLCPGTCLAGVATADSLRPVYSAGQGSIGVSFQDNMLHLGLHLQSGAVVDGVPLATDAQYEPSEISIQVASSIPMPEGDIALDLGITPGTTVYFLDVVNVPDRPFLGFSTEELNPADWSGEIRWLVNGLSGP